jgi:type IV pilus assembly protein PilC
MARYMLKFADGRGAIRQRVEEADSEHELRERYTEQGFLVYSVQPRKALVPAASGVLPRRKRLNLGKFLIFNQQFVTLIRAGLPILKALDLLAERLTDPKLGIYIRSVRDEVRNGALLSEAFRQQRIFPPIYVTSVLAGEKSGSLTEVLDRYISYQKLSLAVRKKLMVSLLYPCLLVVLVFALVIFLVTYVVPNFAQLYTSMSASLPAMTEFLIAFGTAARQYVLAFAAFMFAAVVALRFWSRTASGQETLDAVRLRMPLVGGMWIKYQVSQFARVLGTLLMGGIPLLQALGTASESLGSGVRGGRLDEDLPGPGSGYDRSRGIDRRAADHAGQRRRVFRGRREHSHDGGAFADRAGHHARHGRVRGLRPGSFVSAHLLPGGYVEVGADLEARPS